MVIFAICRKRDAKPFLHRSNNQLASKSYTFLLRLTRYLEAKEEEEAMQELQTIPPLSQSQIGKKNSKKKVSGELHRK